MSRHWTQRGKHCHPRPDENRNDELQNESSMREIDEVGQVTPDQNLPRSRVQVRPHLAEAKDGRAIQARRTPQLKEIG
jgi:hypothetical protein